MIYEYCCGACSQKSTQLKNVANRDNPDPCEHCGGASLRRVVITSPVVLIDGTDPDFPSAASKWERDRERVMTREQKNLRNTGEEYPNKRYI